MTGKMQQESVDKKEIYVKNNQIVYLPKHVLVFWVVKFPDFSFL